jgi:5-methylcytosine-specific restriction endonuclease McrA
MPAKDRADLRTAEWARIKKFILERDGGICYGCGGDADTVDHIQPISKGGTSDLGNLGAMCRSCNSRKGDKLLPPRTNWANPRWGVVVPK